MKYIILIMICAVVLPGCIGQSQRTWVRMKDPTTNVEISIYHTQRNVLFAMFGENASLHKMTGITGDFEGDDNNVGFNEEGVQALELAVKAGICGASGGAGCAAEGLSESFLSKKKSASSDAPLDNVKQKLKTSLEAIGNDNPNTHPNTTGTAGN